MGSLAIQPNSGRAYLLAAVLLAAAVAAQWALRPLLGSAFPFLFFLPAVGVAAMFGGWQPAALVMAGGAAHTAYWMAPSGAFTIRGSAGQIALLGYLAGAGLLVALGGRVSQLRARAAQAEDELQEQVHDLQALHELSGRIALLPSLQQQLQAVLQTACDLQSAPMGLLCLGNRARRTGCSRWPASASRRKACASWSRCRPATASAARPTKSGARW